MSHLRPVDDIDDSMAANVEPDSPRGASYEATTQPRKPAKNAITHFAIVERPGPAPGMPGASTAKLCKRCREPSPGGVYHHDPASTYPNRDLCGKCQGEVNRERMGLTNGGRP